MKPGGVLAVGLVLGLLGGLIYAWFIQPVSYVDTYPPLLEAPFRRDWIRMTAWAYAQDGNWERAKLRLRDLSSEEIQEVTLEVLDEAMAAGKPEAMLRRLASMAMAYGAAGPGVAIYAGVTEVPVTPTAGEQSLEVAASPTPRPTATAMATATRLPHPTPTLTPPPFLPFRILSQTLRCEPTPSLAVSLVVSETVETRPGHEHREYVGQPMRAIWLLWDEGADRAITGLRPERGLGYADFDIEPGRTYNLYVDEAVGLPVLTVQVEPCLPEEGTGWLSRFLIIEEVREPAATLTGSATLTATAILSGSATATLTP